MSTTEANLEKIHAAIPHRAPMLLGDEIVEQSDSHVVCKKTFRDDEYFVQGHYPGHPLVPGVILCECGAQSGAILLSGIMSAGDGVPVLTRMSDVKFKKMVHPGDTIEIHVKLDDQVSSAYYLTAQIKNDGKTAARLSFVCTVAPAP